MDRDAEIEGMDVSLRGEEGYFFET